MVNLVTTQQLDRLNAFKPFNDKIKGKDAITHKTAVKILKNIEFTSKIKSFFTKPAVIITLGIIAGLLVGAAIGLSIVFAAGVPLTAILALKVAKIALAAGLASALPSGLVAAKLFLKSENYMYQAQEAKRLIQMLENK